MEQQRGVGSFCQTRGRLCADRAAFDSKAARGLAGRRDEPEDPDPKTLGNGYGRSRFVSRDQDRLGANVSQIEIELVRPIAARW